VWKHLKGATLNNAHDSLVDAKTQTDVVLDDTFLPFINKTKSIILITDFLSAREQNEVKKKLEPAREVHSSWTELHEGSAFWTPKDSDDYDGHSSGGKAGPRNEMIDAGKIATTLADIFFFLFPLTLFDLIAKMTKHYAYDEWVVEKKGNDRDGHEKKKAYFQRCSAQTPGARHCADKEVIKYPVTRGYIMTWIGILIMHGAILGNNGSIRRY